MIHYLLSWKVRSYVSACTSNLWHRHWFIFFFREKFKATFISIYDEEISSSYCDIYNSIECIFRSSLLRIWWLFFHNESFWSSIEVVESFIPVQQFQLPLNHVKPFLPFEKMSFSQPFIFDWHIFLPVEPSNHSKPDSSFFHQRTQKQQPQI